MIAEEILSAFKESVVPVYSDGVTHETNELLKFVNYVSLNQKFNSPSKFFQSAKVREMSVDAVKKTYEYEKNSKNQNGKKLNITK